MGVMKLGAVLALTLLAETSYDGVEARIYGRVLTSSGELHEGFLRWEGAASWVDFLSGDKELSEDFQKEAETLDPDFALAQRRARSIEAFGVRLTWDEDDSADPVISPSAVRVGHLTSIVQLDRGRARLRLKSGLEIHMARLDNGGGDRLRTLTIEGARGEETELRWQQIDRIDFMSAPLGTTQPAATRLHGTVITKSGQENTGYVAWDLDEVLTADVLDGRQNGEDYEVEFGDIARIQWESERSARVTLRTGEKLVLRGTNDVDRDNRGIAVSTAFGQAKVLWDDFREIRFHAPTSDGVTRDAFSGGAALVGTVESVDGRVLVGEIRWDNDETADWESLDGSGGGVDFFVEFEKIRSIVRNRPHGVTVALRDGGSFDLQGADDVTDRNRGIFVKPEGRTRRLIRWRDFKRVVFES